MNKLSFFLIALVLFNSSCTKVLYTHQEVMARYTTKSDVVNRFGLPSQKREGEGIEEWLYDYGTVSTATNFGNSRTNASIYSGYNSVYGNSNTNTLNVTQFSQYQRYIKFTFDKSGNVTRWDSNVNLTERKAAPGRTVLYVVSVVAISVGLALLLNSDSGGY